MKIVQVTPLAETLPTVAVRHHRVDRFILNRSARAPRARCDAVRADRDYQNRVIAPLVDRHRQVQFVGELGEPEKAAFLGRAHALLFPIELARTILVRRFKMIDRNKLRSVFEQHFTVERMAADYLTVYRKLAGVHRDAARPRHTEGDAQPLRVVA